jgi:5-formaminoimidazole-4-carboxamide-1-beta-D-ribofuranosyl 5'-monophosphate synthetase
MSSSNVDIVADAMRNRIQNISFNNTTELNSTIYFCRANHNEFNYSSNLTYLNGSKIRVKNDDIMVPPRSYATTVGLYSSNNELLAVAKLSEPLKKDPSNELTLRVRLDY